jgi:ATP-dependent DNA helicase Rep
MSDNANSAKILHGLNPQQQQAVKNCQQPCLVLAGAGCGKTSVITRKILWLLHEEKIPSNRLAAVTFTNKAANEMQSRLKKHLSATERKNLTVCTFHSLGLSLLKQNYNEANLSANFSLIDPQDVQKLLKEIGDEQGVYDLAQIRQVSFIISRYKNQNISPEKAFQLEDKLDFAEPEIIELSNRIYSYYEQKLQAYNLIDFDDLLLKPLQLLQHSEIVKNDWGKRFQHILIDEYQDTNECQYQLLIQLVKPDPTNPLPDPQFTAVGDDNQSIYEWRGANPQNLNQLKVDFPNLEIIPLEQNYRSTNTILNASNALIENNQSIIAKKLWSTLGDGNAINLRHFPNNIEEANKITQAIAHHHLINKTSLNDYCVLYRSNYQAEPLEKNLKQLDLAYTVSGGISLFNRSEIKTVLAYLKLMANPQDNVSFLRIINTPKREIGDKTIQQLIQYAENTDLSLFEACNSNGLYGIFTEKICQRLNHFHSWINEKRNKILDDLKTGMDTLLEETHFFDWIIAQAKHKKTGQNQVERIKRLQQWLLNIQKYNEGYDLADIIHHLNLVERLEDQDNKDQASISLMTIHNAKGLEFPYVYLIGLEEGSIPHYNNLQNERGIAEERRLAYVAMTRAKKQLTLSHSANKQTHKGNVKLTPSRFLKEIPQQYFIDTNKQLTPEEKKQQREFYINRMKEMFVEKE